VTICETSSWRRPATFNNTETSTLQITAKDR